MLHLIILTGGRSKNCNHTLSLIRPILLHLTHKKLPLYFLLPYAVHVFDLLNVFHCFTWWLYAFTNILQDSTDMHFVQIQVVAHYIVNVILLTWLNYC